MQNASELSDARIGWPAAGGASCSLIVARLPAVNILTSFRVAPAESIFVIPGWSTNPSQASLNCARFPAPSFGSERYVCGGFAPLEGIVRGRGPNILAART